MWICERCGEITEQLPTHQESEECWGRTVYFEEVDNCFCGGSFVEAIKCVHCGEWISENHSNKKELVKKFEVIPEEWIKENLEQSEQWASEEEFCEECLKEIIKQYEVDKNE